MKRIDRFGATTLTSSIFYTLAVVGVALLMAAPSVQAEDLTFIHLAGSPGGYGGDDGVGPEARFRTAYGAATGSDGVLFVADQDEHTIRRVDADGRVTTLAGSAGMSGSDDGVGWAARFSTPTGVEVAPDGTVWVADKFNHTIRMVSPAGEVVTVAGRAGESGLVDGPGAEARFYLPVDLAVGSGGEVYVADAGNRAIRVIDPEGQVTTLSSNPSAHNGIAVAPSGRLFVASQYSVLEVTPSGEVSILAGGAAGSADGVGAEAQFNDARGIVYHSSGVLYVTDSYSAYTVRRVSLDGEVTTIAGLAGSFGYVDGIGSEARFGSPNGISESGSGGLYVAESTHVRHVTTGGEVSTVAGLRGISGAADGTGDDAGFRDLKGAAPDGLGALVTDSYNHAIRHVTITGEVTTWAGLLGVPGTADGPAGEARFNRPWGIAQGGDGSFYVADCKNHTVRRIARDGTVTTIAGSPGMAGSADGVGQDARFNYPRGVAAAPDGSIVVADGGNHTIRRLSASGEVSTIAGSPGERGSDDGMGMEARFDFPTGVVVDAAGVVYVTDSSNHTIRRIDDNNAVSTLAGQAGSQGAADGVGAEARFWSPRGLTLDGAGNLLVSSGLSIRRVTPDGEVTTVAGHGESRGPIEGSGSDARFLGPSGMAMTTEGALFVCDSVAVRLGLPTLADRATIDSGTGEVGVERRLGSDPQMATDWLWRAVRRPGGSVAPLQGSAAAEARFTPDVAGLYIFRLRATAPGGASVTTVELMAEGELQPFTPAIAVPGMAHAGGAEGSFFKSTVWMTNLASTPVEVRLRYVAAVGSGDGGALGPQLVSIGPGHSVALKDVLGELFQATPPTQGVLVVETVSIASVPLVSARTFNDAGDAGTFGQYIEGIQVAQASAGTAEIRGLRGDGAQRSNVGVVNPGGVEVEATITVLGPMNQALGDPVTVTVPPFSASQVNRVNVAAGAGEQELFGVIVEADGAFVAYASKLDNVTSDPVFVPSTLIPSAEQWLDGMASAAGALGTFWRSDLSLTNASGEAAEVYLGFTPQSESHEPPGERLDLAAWESVLLMDVISETMGLQDAVGSLRIQGRRNSFDPVPILAWGRTYNDQGTEGTFGQLIPGFSATDRLPASGGVLQGISESHAFRTNMGLMPKRGRHTSVTVSAFSADGVMQGQKVYEVSGGTVFISRVLRDLGVDPMDDAYLVVVPERSDEMYAWASVVDNASSDQVFVRPMWR